MAACPSFSSNSNLRRRPLPLSERRLEANRRNAARSTGPRTAEGKARVSRNAIKHGFFVGPERWSSGQRRDFAELFAGFCEDFKAQSEAEKILVATIADSYVRMAALLRYENVAALKYHQECERELNQRIAAADVSEAATLEAHREKLRRAGLWSPTIPGPREANAIIRYEGSLDRAIRRVSAELEGLQRMRLASVSRPSKMQKCRETASSGVLSAARRTSDTANDTIESAKTNPISAMFPRNIGNRHQRRRAKAMARRRT